MYPASEAFHRAIYSRSPAERVLVKFSDLCLDSDDLRTSDLKFTESINGEEELTIGLCPASTLEFKLLNDHGLLADYAFAGECEALLGVLTEETEGDGGMPYAVFRYGMDNPVVFQGHETEPWLTVNGETPTVQPPFPTHAVLMEGNRVYCVSERGDVWGAAWVDGKTWNAMAAHTWGSLSETKWDAIQGYLAPLTSAETWSSLASKTWDELDDGVRVWDDFVPVLEVHPFMRAKLIKWAAARRGVWHNSNVTYEFGNTIQKYEYVPLGWFLPDQPKARKVTQIAFAGYDRMVLFDVDAGPFFAALRYPTTIGEILARLCAYVGVPLATSTFLNSARILDEAPMEAEGVTCREVLGWVAEAACGYARMTRDGELEIAWFGTEPVNLPMTQYFNIDVAEYQVSPIDKLQVKGVKDDIGVIIGSGSNAYVILDNPFLYGTTDAQVRALAAPIYNRLAAYSAFSPIRAKAECDWSIAAGDIIQITLNGTAYSLPVYRQEITWTGGGAKVTYESTGARARPVVSAENRRVWSQKRSVHELVTDINGLSSKISDAEGSVTSLKVTVGGLSTEVSKKVGNNEIISRINQSAEKITIQAQKIALEGVVTVNDNFKVLKDGSIEAKNGKFSGEITAGSGTIAGFTINRNSISVSNPDSSDYMRLYNGSESGLQFWSGKIYAPGYVVIGDLGNVIECSVSFCARNIGISSRLIMASPPTASGTANVCLVQRPNSSGYSLGIITSARRYKKRIQPVDGAGLAEKIDRIPAVTYEPRSGLDKGRDFYGFIAEDMEQEFPWLVDYTTKDGKIEAQSVHYDRTTAILWADAQNTHVELRQLRKELEVLREQMRTTEDI